jgi:small GTP-binding protein
MYDDDNDNVHRCKLVILGDTGVGKTSIAVRFVRNTFRKFETTTGGTFLTQKAQVGEDSEAVVKFNIWDTAGQERFRSVAPLYYKGAKAAIVVYDVTDPFSFLSAQSWIEELSERGDPGVVIALAGNKIDLQNSDNNEQQEQQEQQQQQQQEQQQQQQRPTIIFEDAEEYAKEKGIIHLGTSAKTGKNVRRLFVEIARALPLPDPPPSPPDDGSAEGAELLTNRGADVTTTAVHRFASSVAASVCGCCKHYRKPGGG